MYAVTETGSVALAAWMTVVEEEQSLLAAVVKRYDAVLGKTDDEGSPA